MGVKGSKQSVDISSTPKKAGPDGDLNGKAVEPKIIEDTKINGDAEKPVNGDANGEVKADEEVKKEEAGDDAEVKEETKEGEAEGNNYFVDYSHRQDLSIGLTLFYFHEIYFSFVLINTLTTH